jgi:hypothetical protein
VSLPPLRRQAIRRLKEKPRDVKDISSTTVSEGSNRNQTVQRFDRYRWHLALALQIITLVALVCRRLPQLGDPAIWAEDGYILRDVMVHGWASIAAPLNGYLVLVPRIISATAYTISLSYFPVLSTILGISFTAMVLWIITSSPLMLHGGVALGVAVVFVPTHAEVFGVPLYTFWWASLLLFVAVLWDGQRSDIWRRILLVILGGLSSPMIVLTAPIHVLHMIKGRKGARWVATAAVTCAVIQLTISFVSGEARAKTEFSLSALSLCVQKFVGQHFVGNLIESDTAFTVLGVTAITLLAYVLWPHRNDSVVRTLLYLYIGSVVLSIARYEIEIIDPDLVTARYFFFPSILMSWCLIHAALISKSFQRYISVGMVTLSVINSIPLLILQHEPLSASKHLQTCQYFDVYPLPLHVSGTDLHALMEVPIDGRLAEDRFANELLSAVTEPTQTFPFRVLTDQLLGSLQNAPQIVPSSKVSIAPGVEWPQSIKVSGELAFCGCGSGKMFEPGNGKPIGAVSIMSMSQGQSVYYRGGNSPARLFVRINGDAGDVHSLPVVSGLVLLHFSSTRLPKEFDVELIDIGSGPEDWFEVGFAHANP